MNEETKTTQEIKSILIIGMAGGLASAVTNLLLKKYPKIQIMGIDSRPIKNTTILPQVNYKSMKYKRGNFENLFRENDFDAVLYLGRISHAVMSSNSHIIKKLDLNIVKTKTILDLAKKTGVKKIIVLSTYMTYGAFPDNSVFLKEIAPLRSSMENPDLREVVEVDQVVTNWMWQNQNSINCVVLRPCNIIGTSINNAITGYLSTPYTPSPIDYNPMFQFINEFDMANVVVESIEKVPIGVFNVATDEFITLRNALKKVDHRRIPMLMSLLTPTAKIIKRLNHAIPDYFTDYLKYSCLIDNTELKKHLGENFWHFSIDENLKQLKD